MSRIIKSCLSIYGIGLSCELERETPLRLGKVGTDSYKPLDFHHADMDKLSTLHDLVCNQCSIVITKDPMHIRLLAFGEFSGQEGGVAANPFELARDTDQLHGGLGLRRGFEPLGQEG